MGQMFKMIWKVFLLFIGGVMLIGGGICAVTDAFLGLANIFRADGLFMLVWMTAISCLIAWAGWAAIKASGLISALKTERKIASKKTDKLDA